MVMTMPSQLWTPGDEVNSEVIFISVGEPNKKGSWPQQQLLHELWLKSWPKLAKRIQWLRKEWMFNLKPHMKCPWTGIICPFSILFSGAPTLSCWDSLQVFWSWKRTRQFRESDHVDRVTRVQIFKPSKSIKIRPETQSKVSACFSAQWVDWGSFFFFLSWKYERAVPCCHFWLLLPASSTEGQAGRQREQQEWLGLETDDSSKRIQDPKTLGSNMRSSLDSFVFSPIFLVQFLDHWWGKTVLLCGLQHDKRSLIWQLQSKVGTGGTETLVDGGLYKRTIPGYTRSENEKQWGSKPIGATVSSKQDFNVNYHYAVAFKTVEIGVELDPSVSMDLFRMALRISQQKRIHCWIKDRHKAIDVWGPKFFFATCV